MEPEIYELRLTAAVTGLLAANLASGLRPQQSHYTFAGNSNPTIAIDSLNSIHSTLSFRQANTELARLQYVENGASDYMEYNAPRHYFATGYSVSASRTQLKPLT